LKGENGFIIVLSQLRSYHLSLAKGRNLARHLILKTKTMEKYYEPTGTYEFFEDGVFFNAYGQQLRDPQEYDTSMEGYTPFGDE